MSLSPQQLRFCKEYVIDCNGTKAAIRAGYSKNTAKQQGSRLLTHDDVKAEIAKLLKPVENKLRMSAEEVIETLSEFARDSKLKVNDRLTALDKLGKHFKLFTDMHEQIHSFTMMPSITKDGSPIIFDVGLPKE